jgi:hypothetical protein
MKIRFKLRQRSKEEVERLKGRHKGRNRKGKHKNFKKWNN